MYGYLRNFIVASVAQSAERQSHNLKVASSSLAGGIPFLQFWGFLFTKPKNHEFSWTLIFVGMKKRTVIEYTHDDGWSFKSTANVMLKQCRLEVYLRADLCF